MSSTRINGDDRLKGDAKFISVCQTVEPHVFAFTVWSKKNRCAAADILHAAQGRAIYGVLYEIPDYLMTKATARVKNRTSLDEIEGQGTNYVQQIIRVVDPNGRESAAITYVVKNRCDGLKTSIDYVTHILRGLQEHHFPEEYCRYIVSRVLENNSLLSEELQDRGFDEDAKCEL